MIRIFLLLLFISTSAFAEFSPKMETVKTDGGIKAYLLKDEKYPIIAISIYFKAGYLTDEKEGLSNLVTSLLDEGAGNYSSKEFQDLLYDNGIEMSFDTSDDITSVTMTCVKEKQALAFELLGLALKSPRFDESAVARVKEQIISSIKRAEKNPSSIAAKAWKNQAYPDSVFKKDEMGTKDSVNSITKEDLSHYMKTKLALDNMYVGVSGDIDGKTLSKILDKTFADFTKKAEFTKITPKNINLSKAEIKVSYDSPQSIVFFGQDGIKRGDKDYYTALILNYVLGGGGFSSRLVKEVREKNSLVYGISTWLAVSDYVPRIMGYAGMSTKNVPLAMDLIKKTWKDIQKNGISKNELTNAKKYLLGSFPFRFSSSELISKILASVMIQNLGENYFADYNKGIEKVTNDDIKRVAGYLFDEKKILFTIVGKN